MLDEKVTGDCSELSELIGLKKQVDSAMHTYSEALQRATLKAMKMTLRRCDKKGKGWQGLNCSLQTFWLRPRSFCRLKPRVLLFVNSAL